MTEWAEPIIQFFQQYGLVGLCVLAFLEAFISPVLPDVLLIPLALAAPEQAVKYSVLATLASVTGGFVGYSIGDRFGIPVLRRFVPTRHTEKIKTWLELYGGWAVFIAAMAPIPYKFTSIAAGTFRVGWLTFFLASLLGRAKRFVIIGVLIWLYGQSAMNLLERCMNNVFLLGTLGIGGVVAILVLWRWRGRRKTRLSSGGQG